ncbi:MAG: hypothetical protein Q9208_008295 [Pyrenodesmia sp. 3 TL-2023]
MGAHSTCSASKAVGRFAGSAKRATLVVVKFYPKNADAALIFETIAQDIVAKGRTHHSVVTNSWSQSRKRPTRADRKEASDIMMLVRRGVPVILGAGNDGPGFITKLPASLADREDNLLGPIVVGAVDNDGNKAPFSEELRDGRVLWAPGVGISCAKTSPDIGTYVTEWGTSYVAGRSAAPLVAGVVAEQLTEMNRQGLFHPALRNKYIYEHLQWKRPSGLPVLWNGMDGTRPGPLDRATASREES